MHQKNQHRAQSIQPSDMHCTVGVHHVCHDIKHHVNYGRLFQLTYFYYYCYAAFNAPCVGHKDDESQVQTQKVSGHHHTPPFNGPFVRDYPGEPVPER